jgi:glucose/arabinose dehydrogenase
MAFAPDGRLFVAQQTGALRVVKNNTLLPTPFLSLNVDARGERGLLGVAFDPAFASNRFVYVYHTVPGNGTTTPPHNRVSRFTADAGNPDRAAANSERVIFDLPSLTGATNHNGGAIAFGPDGKLYVATGENADPANAPSLRTTLGKILRLNADGSIPADNPFYAETRGPKRAIWATGLRNPFNFAFDFARRNGRMFINDVGQRSFEEVNEGVAGSNYGWPATEGPTRQRGVRAPVFSYARGTGPTTGQAIVGAAFYTPATRTFPRNYAGDYFFADLASGWIRRLDPATGEAAHFARDISAPVALAVSPDGALYYAARGTGSIHRVQYTAAASATASPPATSLTAPALPPPASPFSSTPLRARDDAVWDADTVE